MANIAQHPPLNLPWFTTPFFEKSLANSNFDERGKAELRAYARDGYLIFDPGIEDVDAVARELQENVPYPIKDGKPFNRVQDEWRRNASVRKLACLPGVLNKLQIIYQRGTIPFQTLNFPVGTEQRTHSDSIHFSSMPERWMCGVWLALEDVDEDNGPLHYYPGSQRLPILHMHDLGVSPQNFEDLGQFYSTYEQVVAEMLDASGLPRVEVSLKKGQALIWDANLFHGGSPIRDPKRTRLTQVTHYFFEGCAYYGPLQSDMPLGKIVWRSVDNIIDGQPIQHVYNGVSVTAPMFNGTPQMLRVTATEPMA